MRRIYPYCLLDGHRVKLTDSSAGSTSTADCSHYQEYVLTSIKLCCSLPGGEHPASFGEHPHYLSFQHCSDLCLQLRNQPFSLYLIHVSSTYAVEHSPASSHLHHITLEVFLGQPGISEVSLSTLWPHREIGAQGRKTTVHSDTQTQDLSPGRSGALFSSFLHLVL